MSKFLETLKDLPVSRNLLHRVVVAEEANWRQGTQSAKTRAEVWGGGKKPYKQKKTGNARQGSTRAPHYAHGSMALAVKPRNYDKKVNRKERRLALLEAFADKLQSGHIVVVDSIRFEEARTRQATELLAKNGLGETRRVLVLMAEHHEETLRSFRNLAAVEVRAVPGRDGKGEGFSTRDLVVAHKILVDKAGLEKLEETYGAKRDAVEPQAGKKEDAE